MTIKDLFPWFFGCLIVLCVVWAPVSCTKMNNEKIESAIKNGVDPVIAQCTYSSAPDRVICAIATMSKNK